VLTSPECLENVFFVTLALLFDLIIKFFANLKYQRDFRQPFLATKIVLLRSLREYNTVLRKQSENTQLSTKSCKKWSTLRPVSANKVLQPLLESILGVTCFVDGLSINKT